MTKKNKIKMIPIIIVILTRWECDIPILHHYDIFPPGGNMTGGNMLVLLDGDDDDDDDD